MVQSQIREGIGLPMLTQEVQEQVKAGLFAGQYNLLLGSGASLDSFDRHNKPIVGASDLTRSLNTLKAVNANTSLSRVSLLLTREEVQCHLTDRYSSCRPGGTVRFLPKFVWKSIYTFNIDDCIESAYEQDLERAQESNSINFVSPYRTADVSIEVKMQPL